ncbi:hypothetical protein [Lacrimispora amygdalina]|jgi:hypothetical protein|uniref:hypothetical protein n=1 Tax=Lacrimispora amygdalina TaxID=253257 RepID=UPI000BE345C3|nr:hypothetical protein [Lacrimispora amygdalina]
MYEDIDSFESENYYYIDYIPYNTNDPSYLELEEYFVKSYLKTFSKKITRIILKLIYYYQCEIYLIEPIKKIPKDFNFPFEINIRNNTPKKLAYIIRQIILKDFSSMKILFPEFHFLISIKGEFSVAVFNAPDKVLQLLEQLAQQEGLFLKKHS